MAEKIIEFLSLDCRIADRFVVIVKNTGRATIGEWKDHKIKWGTSCTDKVIQNYGDWGEKST